MRTCSNPTNAHSAHILNTSTVLVFDKSCIITVVPQNVKLKLKVNDSFHIYNFVKFAAYNSVLL